MKGAHLAEGQLSSIQLGNKSQRERIQSGTWAMTFPSSSSSELDPHPMVQLEERFTMVKPDGSINPSLELVANRNNTIEIQIPTHEKDELVIESNGTELASSGDIDADS